MAWKVGKYTILTRILLVASTKTKHNPGEIWFFCRWIPRLDGICNSSTSLINFLWQAPAFSRDSSSSCFFKSFFRSLSWHEPESNDMDVWGGKKRENINKRICDSENDAHCDKMYLTLKCKAMTYASCPDMLLYYFPKNCWKTILLLDISKIWYGLRAHSAHPLQVFCVSSQFSTWNSNQWNHRRYRRISALSCAMPHFTRKIPTNALLIINVGDSLFYAVSPFYFGVPCVSQDSKLIWPPKAASIDQFAIDWGYNLVNWIQFCDTLSHTRR